MKKKPPRTGIGAEVKGLGALLLGQITEDHPTLGSDSLGLALREDIYDMQLDLIELRGPYARTPEEVEAEEGFDGFCEAIRENGTIGQPIAVRTIRTEEGGIRYGLVWGLRRYLAAKRAGFRTVPVQNLGEIPDSDSLLLQALENLLRQEMHHAQTARTLYQVRHLFQNQARMAKVFGKDEGWISIMIRTGEAIADMTPEEQLLLQDRRVQFRAFQEIAKLPSIEEKKRELLRLVTEGEPSPIARQVAKRTKEEPAVFQPKQLRDGRSFRLRWRDRDLIENPEEFAEALERHIRQEIVAIANRMDELAKRQKRDVRERLDRARSQIEHLLSIAPSS